MELNEKLTRAVEESGMKQAFIAEKVGLSESTLSTLLNGKRKVMAQEFFEICNVIRRDPNEVYSMQ